MTGYKLDAAAFRRHVLNSDFMVEEMRGRGERVKAAAEAAAPVYESGSHPGRYKDGFELDVHKDGGIHQDRAEAVIRNATLTDDGKSLAVFVEYGTENNPPHHTLGTALDAAK